MPSPTNAADRCPTCAKPPPARARYCPRCGQPLHAVREPRDVSGWTEQQNLVGASRAVWLAVFILAIAVTLGATFRSNELAFATALVAFLPIAFAVQCSTCAKELRDSKQHRRRR